eukprot:CAMPEP_0179170782 /NCGR_PEP_ID=MMETSP0796-20121207/84154_1 /TAXON_ID=73915 /ORGANISM="Pyrodinium bahamense, Strain pbaha01" /LENGTH=50 /DNA_ID=CAMNT_0020873797 /DNA_START=77 /DNA_END=225 /DNA_ORIENTATION=+
MGSIALQSHARPAAFERAGGLSKSKGQGSRVTEGWRLLGRRETSAIGQQP